MAQITLKGAPLQTVGELPAIGTTAPDFTLIRTDLSTVTLADFAGHTKILNIFPSIDTPVCAQSTRTFNQQAADLPNTKILCVAADLPFALGRFCAADGIAHVEALSTFRSDFQAAWGLGIASGILAGFCARAVVVLDANNIVRYVELVPEIAQEPNYAAALAAARSCA